MISLEIKLFGFCFFLTAAVGPLRATFKMPLTLIHWLRFMNQQTRHVVTIISFCETKHIKGFLHQYSFLSQMCVCVCVCRVRACRAPSRVQYAQNSAPLPGIATKARFGIKKRSSRHEWGIKRTFRANRDVVLERRSQRLAVKSNEKLRLNATSEALSWWMLLSGTFSFRIFCNFIRRVSSHFACSLCLELSSWKCDLPIGYSPLEFRGPTTRLGKQVGPCNGENYAQHLVSLEHLGDLEKVHHYCCEDLN